MYKNIISQTEFQRNNKKFEELLEKGEVVVVKNNKPSFVAIKVSSYSKVQKIIKEYQKWNLGQIIVELRRKEKFFKAKGINSVSIFGSYSRGEENIDSDLDLVYTSNEKGIKLIALSEFLDDSLDGLKVEALPLSGLKQSIVKNIEADLINVF